MVSLHWKRHKFLHHIHRLIFPWQLQSFKQIHISDSQHQRGQSISVLFIKVQQVCLGLWHTTNVCIVCWNALQLNSFGLEGTGENILFSHDSWPIHIHQRTPHGVWAAFSKPRVDITFQTVKLKLKSELLTIRSCRLQRSPLQVASESCIWWGKSLIKASNSSPSSAGWLTWRAVWLLWLQRVASAPFSRSKCITCVHRGRN